MNIKSLMARIRTLEWRAIPRWFVAAALGWKEYIMLMPQRARQLTRYEFRVRSARLLFAVVIVYFIAGIAVGLGYYVPVKWCSEGMFKKVKLCPARLDNSFANFWTNLYPYPAEIVGWKTVTLGDAAGQEKIIKYFAEHSGNPLPDRFEVDKKIISSLEEVELAQKALKQNKVKVKKKDIDDVIKQIEDENGGKDKVKELLQSLYGLNLSEFRTVVRDQLYKDKVRSDVLRNIKARHILLSDENQAKDVKGKIERGEVSFEDASKQFSADQGSKDEGGLIKVDPSSEFVGRDGGLVKEFSDVAFALEVSKISDPVKSEFGWHIIRVDEIKGKVDKSYADYMSEIRKKVIIWTLVKR